MPFLGPKTASILLVLSDRNSQFFSSPFLPNFALHNELKWGKSVIFWGKFSTESWVQWKNLILWRILHLIKLVLFNFDLIVHLLCSLVREVCFDGLGQWDRLLYQNRKLKNDECKLKWTLSKPLQYLHN